MSELNRERIIRGLACCKGSYDCFTCDIYKRGCAGFRDGLARDALALINELTEENERLRAQNETLEINNKDFKYRIYELSRDNEEWEHENKDLECDNDMLRERITEAKADTVREIIQRIKEDAKAIFLLSDPPKIMLEIREDALDQIAKEMVEGKG